MLEPTDAQKHRHGIRRLWHACGYSAAGLRAGWMHHAAFRMEVLFAVVLIPSAFWIGRGWVECFLLAATVTLVLIVELLNTGIELAIDRIGPEWHALSKQAKDIGSAAVFLSLLLCSATWLAAILTRWG